MPTLRFRLRAAPDQRLDLAGLTPARLSGLSVNAIEHLVLATGKTTLHVGDVFQVTGPLSDEIWFEGGSDRFDNIGRGLTGGIISVEGSVGNGAGRSMKAGRLEIEGGAGAYLASGQSGGLITLGGPAGDYVGAVGTGKRFGMTGGTVVVGGSIGERAGDKMRRGTIIVRGKTGAMAGSRMCGGTIIAEGGLGPMPGHLMRRGTLITPVPPHLSGTFADCGIHDLVILKVMRKAMLAELQPLAPRDLPTRVRRFAGDLATIGRGEILVAA
jgi:formylmethanofuran dehydrogenase subunit C